MTANRRPAAPSRLLLVLLLAALAVGAAASILLAAHSANPTPGPGSPISEVYPSNDVIILSGALLFLAIAVPLVYDRIRGGAGYPGRALVVTLVVVLALIVFAVLARYAGSGGGPFGHGSGNATLNTTSNSTTVNFNNTTNPLGGSGGTISFLNLHVPSWLLFPGIALVALVVALVAVPRAREYLHDRAEARLQGPLAPEEVRGALGAAAQELAAGTDPRAVILRLYARLLHRVEPIAGNIDPATPEEIRSLHLVRMGIRPGAAEALTRLFEEARYSTHPLGVEAATRASQAIAEAERDLARVEPEP